jgi:hypothetical protein
MLISQATDQHRCLRALAVMKQADAGYGFGLGVIMQVSLTRMSSNYNLYIDVAWIFIAVLLAGTYCFP